MTPQDETQTARPVDGASAGGIGRKEHLINLGVVVAIAALVFSAISYFFSRHDQQRADERAARTQLTDVLTQLDGLDRLYANVPGYNDPTNPLGQYAGSQASNTERLPLVAQAERLVREYPSIAGAADYLSLAFAQTRLAEPDTYIRARVYLDRAKALATKQHDVYLAFSADINVGRVDYRLGDDHQGSAVFQKLLYDNEGVNGAFGNNDASIAYYWVSAASVSTCPAFRAAFEQASPMLVSSVESAVSAALEKTCP